jgi:hypothetical protein
MAFKNDPISTVLDSVKAILTFSFLFWSISILFNSFRGPDPDPDWTGPDPDPDRIRPSKTLKRILMDQNKILKVSMAFTLSKTVEIGSFLKAII